MLNQCGCVPALGRGVVCYITLFMLGIHTHYSINKLVHELQLSHQINLKGLARLRLLQNWMLKTPLYWTVASNFTCSQISLIGV